MHKQIHSLAKLLGPWQRVVVLLSFAIMASHTARAQTNPFTLKDFRINNGELISRSRTVRLTIAASSTQGPISSMQLGDSVLNGFRPFQTFRSSTSFTFPEGTTGRQVIGVILRDRTGNTSPQYLIPVDIIPDLPIRPALTSNAIPKAILRRGNFAVAHLTPALNDPSDPLVQMSTTQGEIIVELYRSKAPLTVANFLNYVDTNRYDNSFFHRLVKDFVIQGGGYFVETVNNQSTIKVIPNFGTVVNEFGESNKRGTIAMAKVEGDPDSATSEWFFNLEDNSGNLDQQNGGFTVFGKVFDSSLSVLNDQLNGLRSRPTISLNLGNGIEFSNLPIIADLGERQSVNLGDLVLLPSVSRFKFSVVRQIPGVKASILNNYLLLEPSGAPSSRNATITIRAVAPDGRTLDFPVAIDVQTNHPMLAGGVGTRNVSLREDTPVDITIPVSNPDGSPLLWQVGVEPTKGTLERLPVTKPGSQVIRYTPNANQNGTDTFRVIVVDYDGELPQEGQENVQPKGSDGLNVNLQITPVNDLPTITAPTSLSATSAGVVEFDVTVNDVETGAGQLTLTTTTTSPSIIRNTLAVVATEGNTRKVRFQASPVTTPSAASISLTVTDANAGRRTIRIPVTVLPASP